MNRLLKIFLLTLLCSFVMNNLVLKPECYAVSKESFQAWLFDALDQNDFQKAKELILGNKSHAKELFKICLEYKEYMGFAEYIAGVFKDAGDNTLMRKYYASQGKRWTTYGEGMDLYDNGKYKDAKIKFQDALNQAIDRSDEQLQANCNLMMGRIYYDFDGYTKALEYFQKALELSRHVNDYDETTTVCYRLIGSIYRYTEKYEEAETNLKNALDSSGLVFSNTGSRYELAMSHECLGYLYKDMGKYDDALDYYEKAIKHLIANYDRTNPLVGMAYSEMGVIYGYAGRFEDGINSITKGQQIIIDSLGKEDYQVGSSYNDLGLLYAKQKKYDDAINSYNIALDIIIKAVGEDSPSAVTVYSNLSDLYEEMGKTEDAEKYSDKVSEITQRVLGDFSEQKNTI